MRKKEDLKSKKLLLIKKVILLHKAGQNVASIVQYTLHELRWEILLHLASLLNPALPDHHWFQSMKPS